LHEIPLADLEMSGKNLPIFRQWMLSSSDENRFAVSADEVISTWSNLRNFCGRATKTCIYAYAYEAVAIRGMRGSCPLNDEIFWQSL
jgi:hypothetical protein